nr:hypothetical protein SEVIR_6G080050v2 [Setaria viridis]
MVQRVVRHGGSAASEQAATETARKDKGRRDAIMAIKAQVLRCSEQQGRRRFKRGYLCSGGDGRGDAADSAIFYLACLAVCTTATGSKQ